MKIPYYQVNAFASQQFLGNPAGVCLLDSWLPEEQMQYISTENNVSETAFIVPDGDDYQIRWFTPSVEVDLCGHATLAAGYVLFIQKGLRSPVVNFHSSKSGILSVSREEDSLLMDFPADELHEASPEELKGAFHDAPEEVFRGKTDYMLIYRDEKQVAEIEPDMNALMNVAARGVIVTAPGTEADFVSRFFAPQSGIPEDPVTGSAHTSLTPYWAKRMNRNTLIAWQLSARGGILVCRLTGDRVVIEGRARLYSEGYIHI